MRAGHFLAWLAVAALAGCARDAETPPNGSAPAASDPAALDATLDASLDAPQDSHDHAHTQASLGKAYSAMGKGPQALEALGRALDLDGKTQQSAVVWN